MVSKGFSFCCGWCVCLLFCFITCTKICINTLRQRPNGRRLADDTFKRIFLNENIRISIKVSLKFVPKGPINNIPALVQIMAWRWLGDKPLSEPMVVSLLTHICVAPPQWVKHILTNWISLDHIPRMSAEYVYGVWLYKIVYIKEGYMSDKIIGRLAIYICNYS